jgi:hypothetical protein
MIASSTLPRLASAPYAITVSSLHRASGGGKEVLDLFPAGR